MTVGQRRKAQTTALVALLKTLPEQQLRDVLAGLGHAGAVVVPQDDAKTRRSCGICGLPYALCRARWEYDHDFELKISVTRKGN